MLNKLIYFISFIISINITYGIDWVEITNNLVPDDFSKSIYSIEILENNLFISTGSAFYFSDRNNILWKKIDIDDFPNNSGRIFKINGQILINYNHLNKSKFYIFNEETNDFSFLFDIDRSWSAYKIYSKGNYFATIYDAFGTDLFISKDSGKTWEKNKFLDSLKYLRSIQINNINGDIIAFGTNLLKMQNYMYYSNDDGITWSEWSFTFKNTGTCEFFDFLPNNKIIYIFEDYWKNGEPGFSYYISDIGGDNLQMVYKDTSDWFTGWSYFKDNFSFIQMDSITVYSTDYGLTWAEFNTPATGIENISSFTMDDDFKLYIGTFNGHIYKTDLSGLAVEDQSKQELSLFAFPNPTSGKIKIKFKIDSPGLVTVKLIDALGNQRLLKSEYKSPGDYFEEYDLSEYSQGIYNIVMQSTYSISNEKIIILK